RHLWIEGRGIRHQQFQPFLMADPGQREMRGVVCGVHVGPKPGSSTSARCDTVEVGKNDLIAEPVSVAAVSRGTQIGYEIEAQPHFVHAHKEVAYLPRETVAPISIGCRPFREAPVARY